MHVVDVPERITRKNTSTRKCGCVSSELLFFAWRQALERGGRVGWKKKRVDIHVYDLFLVKAHEKFGHKNNELTRNAEQFNKPFFSKNTVPRPVYVWILTERK